MTDAESARMRAKQPWTVLVEFLLARYGELEMWAREASLLDTEAGYVDGGVHWRWADSYSSPIDLDPVTMTYADESSDGLSLESVETYQSRSVGQMPQLAVMGACEVPVAVAGHIVRHDPAAVLRRLASDRAIVALYQESCERRDAACAAAEGRGDRRILGRVCRLLAEAHCQHPDFDPAWRM